MLRPIDISVLSWLVSAAPKDWTQTQVASALGISKSNVHRALRQLEESRLVRARTPQTTAMFELFTGGLRYVFPAEIGAPARGLITARVGDDLADDTPLVWACESGSAVGPTLSPLHPCVPEAALKSPEFHELMSVIDACRVGRARSRVLAERWMKEKWVGVP